jgi:predicted ATP-grasp superfamily ATP-dependent carboligase
VRHDVLIFGASCRAAAFSALRCGLTPRCADYFADCDLARVCDIDRIDPAHAGREFTALAGALPPSPWIYTGGFENHPDWVEAIARRHRLWGINADTLRAVRDPVRVAKALRALDIRCPAVSRDLAGLPRDGSWLVKPLRSAGGHGIEPLTAGCVRLPRPPYFQERIAGPSFSALFIGDSTGARLIGVTMQLIGAPGSPFSYRGNIGPLPVAAPLASKLRILGRALASTFGLAGWFGVDYVLRDDDPWPVEINPRYTASVEIHELALRRALLADHRRACEGADDSGANAGPFDAAPRRVVGKLILYAPRRLIAPKISPGEYQLDDAFAIASIADIPSPGTCIEPGHPVMTVMAGGESADECWQRLIQLEDDWMTRLGLAAGEWTSIG